MHQDPLSYFNLKATEPKRECPIVARERIAQEREQHYYFTLHDFEELVRQYGAPKILQDMNEEVYWSLSKEIQQ